MKLLPILFAAGCVAIFATGCVSPRAYSRASTKFPRIPDGAGRIMFYRGNDFVGGAEWDTVRLNGEITGYLSPISFFYVDRQPGNYVVFAEPKGLFSRAIGGHQLSFSLDAGEIEYVCLTQELTSSGAAIGGATAGILGAVGGGASPTPTLEDKDSAMKVLPKCLYYEGRYHW